MLFNLTVQQFLELIKRIVKREIEIQLQNMEDNKGVVGNPSAICGIEMACEITRLSKATVYSKVSLRQIPCLSRGKPLLFSRSHLELWIRAGRPKTDSIDEIEKNLEENRNKDQR